MKQPQERRLRPQYLRLVLIFTFLTALPHALHLPLLISLFFCGMVAWRFISLSHPRLAPGRFIIFLLTLGGVLLVYLQHQTLIGRIGGVSLLMVMLALKLLELYKQRDVYVVAYISYFLVITQFLFSQSILLTLYLLCLVICLTALLLEINRVTPSKWLLDPIRRTLYISLQALPIAVILFVLFPRLSHPIWHFGIAGQSAYSGLSDRVSPGSISQLIQSSAIAFRARFLSETPPPELRYWRALVLWDTDGFEWFNKNQTTSSGNPLMIEPLDEPITYEVMLEANYKRWLFALDLPISAPEGSIMNQDYILTTDHPVRRTSQYMLTSATQYLTQKPNLARLQMALKLPDNVTPQQRELVDNWRQQAGSDEDLVNAALRHFNEQPFVYTLNPPYYAENPIHQFLFEDREGFCEHYASSFTQLMRVAGIPSRMVIGYQGGEYNPMGDYYILRQSDAHAWSEVWLQKNGWTRIDPTAAVAPERVRHSIQPEFGDLGSPVLFQLDENGFVTSSIKNLKLALDAANIGWRRWVIGYSQKQQFKLMRNFGLNFSSSGEWSGMMIVLIGLVLLLITLRILLQGRHREEPVLKGYNRFCKKLSRVGLIRDSNEGPLDFSRRIYALRPDLSPQTQQIIDLYIKLRYAEKDSSQAVNDFLDQVRRFRPKQA